jgi:hypothetical protein
MKSKYEIERIIYGSINKHLVLHTPVDDNRCRLAVLVEEAASLILEKEMVIERYIDVNGKIPVPGDRIEFVVTKKQMTVLSMEEQGLFPPSMLNEEFKIITE